MSSIPHSLTHTLTLSLAGDSFWRRRSWWYKVPEWQLWARKCKTSCWSGPGAGSWKDASEGEKKLKIWIFKLDSHENITEGIRDRMNVLSFLSYFTVGMYKLRINLLKTCECKYKHTPRNSVYVLRQPGNFPHCKIVTYKHTVAGVPSGPQANNSKVTQPANWSDSEASSGECASTAIRGQQALPDQ